MKIYDHTDPRNHAPGRRCLIIPVLIALLVVQGILLLPTALADPNTEDLQAKVDDNQERLVSMQGELERLDSVIASRDEALEQSRHQMADANARLSRAEDTYNETLAVYEQRLVALYKNGEHQFFSIIVDSEGINDALTRISYVSKISDNDVKLINRLKAEEFELRAAREEVEALKQLTAENVDSLEQQRTLLAADIEALQQEQDKAMLEMVKARAIEQEAAARRLAEEAAAIDLSGMMTGTLVVQNTPPPGLEPTGNVLHGVASWYGPGFHGNRTANGEVYDMYAFTAAHKSLPFNTWLKVSYNGRSVFVRINDRGPYIGGRFLDLSKAGAQALGFSGVAYVTAEIYR